MSDGPRTDDERRRNRSMLYSAYGTATVLILAVMIYCFASGSAAMGAAMIAILAGLLGTAPMLLKDIDSSDG